MDLILCRIVSSCLLFFITLVFVGVLLLLENVSDLIRLICVGGMVLFCWIGLFILADPFLLIEETGEHQSTQIRSIETDQEQPQSSLPTTMTRNVIDQRVRAQRVPSRQDSQLFFFAFRTRVARLVMRVLPPAVCFRGDEGCQRNCPICLEEFKNGELIQPFGVCVHEFHSSCINLWLLSGNITCPVCRERLSIY